MPWTLFPLLATLTLFAVLVYRQLSRRKFLKAQESVLAAHRRGDHESALQAAERLPKSGSNRQQYCFYRGAMLFELGHLGEAERWLRESLVLSTRAEMNSGGKQRATAAKQSALASTTLGQILLEKREYEDASRHFERVGSHRNLAETWLRRGVRPQDALQLAQTAVDEDRLSDGLLLSQDLATLAWAVASTSKDASQVDRLVGEAIPLAANVIPPSAQVHYQSGLAYAALGNLERSAELFAKAASIDPAGRWGRAARART